MKYTGEHDALLAEAYNAGEWRITCPVCQGGPEGKDTGTMALFATKQGNVGGICFRASCQQTLFTGEPAAPRKADFVPRPLTMPYRSEPGNACYGRRVLVADPSVTVWKLTNLDGEHMGHITRTADKQIRTYMDVDRSPYYYNHARPSICVSDGPLWVFEDPVSAAMCSSPAIALLGTNLADGTAEDIKNAGPNNVLVALDPGAEDAAMRVYIKLSAMGVPVTFVPMAADFKDLDSAERYALELAYA